MLCVGKRRFADFLQMTRVARGLSRSPTLVNPIVNPPEPSDEHFGPAFPNSLRNRDAAPVAFCVVRRLRKSP